VDALGNCIRLLIWRTDNKIVEIVGGQDCELLDQKEPHAKWSPQKRMDWPNSSKRKRAHPERENFLGDRVLKCAGLTAHCLYAPTKSNVLPFHLYRSPVDPIAMSQGSKDIQSMGLWTLARLNATVHGGPCEAIDATDFLTLLHPKPLTERVTVRHITQLDGPHQGGSVNLFQSLAPHFISMWHGTRELLVQHTPFVSNSPRRCTIRTLDTDCRPIRWQLYARRWIGRSWICCLCHRRWSVSRNCMSVSRSAALFR